jgi:hypothetical protein
LRQRARHGPRKRGGVGLFIVNVDELSPVVDGHWRTLLPRAERRALHR